MMQVTCSEDAARQFLLVKGILRSTITCASCSCSMSLSSCSASKSADLYIFRCSGTGCKKTRSIRTGSYLEGSSISFATFIHMVYLFSSKNLTCVEIAAYTGASRQCVTEWKSTLLEAVATYIYNNPQPIGGPGIIVELDEAMFGKRKYNRGRLREGTWVLGGVCRSTGHCFLIPCPGNRRSAAVLLPLIQSNVLPGTIVHTDQWAAYNGLTFTATGYTHLTVNHSLNFVDPLTGCHTNTQDTSPVQPTAPTTDPSPGAALPVDAEPPSTAPAAATTPAAADAGPVPDLPDGPPAAKRRKTKSCDDTSIEKLVED